MRADRRKLYSAQPASAELHGSSTSSAKRFDRATCSNPLLEARPILVCWQAARSISRIRTPSSNIAVHGATWRHSPPTRRLVSRYYVQTPNSWFPYEPHFRFLGFQYLPRHVRVVMIMRFSLGFFLKIDDRSEAEAIIGRHQLISTRQMARLFPNGELQHEKFVGMNKSIIAIHDLQPGAN